MSQTPKDTLTPWRALLSPLWVGALVLLVLNDHVLKEALHNAWTGKLSDVAGLFLAPALLATLLGVKRVRGVWACVFATSGVFAAINISPTLAMSWDGALSAIGVPFHTTCDPTDLLALPAAWLGGLLALSTPRAIDTRRSARAPKRAVVMGLVLIGSLACVATAPNPAEEPREFSGSVTILNRTNEMHLLEISPLDPGVYLDCDEIGRDPLAHLSNELFESRSPYIIPLFSGEEVAISPREWSTFFEWQEDLGNDNGSCRAFLLRSRVLPDSIAFWKINEVPFRFYYHNRAAPPELDGATGTIVIDADYSDVSDPKEMHDWREHTCPLSEDRWQNEIEWDQCDTITAEQQEEAARVPAGARYTWRSINNDIPLHFERPRFDTGSGLPTPARCRTPGPGQGLDWEVIPDQASWLVAGVEQGIDGCHTLSLFDGARSRTFTICAPWGAISRLDHRDEIAVTFERKSLDSFHIRVLSGASSLGFRGIELTRGLTRDLTIDLSFTREVRSGCAPIVESCATTSLPIDLRVRRGQEGFLVSPGESIDLGDLFGELYIARAVYKPIINTTCEEEANPFNQAPDTYVEYARVY